MHNYHCLIFFICQEFGHAPPGALALDCMAFFAHQYTQQYRQIVLENSRERADEQDCPFAQASVQLTQLLAEILQIGVPPSEDGEDGRSYHPMFFFKEKPFEECFCVCIQRFTRTWKEMKASMADFNKVCKTLNKYPAGQMISLKVDSLPMVRFFIAFNDS